MVKLFVSDVDGTLLDAGQNTIKKEILDKLSELKSRGVTLAVASGRSYHSLNMLFESIADGTYFVCCDGSVCVHDGKVIYTKPIGSGDILRLIRDDIYSKMCVMLSTPTCSYVLRGGEEFAGMVSGLHTDIVKKASQLYDIKEPVCRISIYSGEQTPKPQGFMSKALRVSYNANGWCEYVSAISDKGLALSDLQMRLYLSKFDTMCLGDGENDITMMKKSKYAVSIGRAPESVRRESGSYSSDAVAVLDRLLAELN